MTFVGEFDFLLFIFFFSVFETFLSVIGCVRSSFSLFILYISTDMEILGSIKSYEWGSTGKKSKVAQLALKHDENFSFIFNETTPYAELW